MKIVNASAWHSLSCNDVLTYSSISELNSIESPDWSKVYKPFAYVRVDAASKSIDVWRDHFGQEPLFYARHGNAFIFGSNIPDILQHLNALPNHRRILSLHFERGQQESALYSNETHLEGIFRVEPGHHLSIRGNSCTSKAFWQLDPNAESRLYPNDSDYDEHFASLLLEAVNHTTQGHDHIAAEISGGMDSSMLAIACQLANISFYPLSHIAPPQSEEKDDLQYALRLAKHLEFGNIDCVDASLFDPIETMNWASKLFAGAPSFVFPVLANNIHRQALKKGCSLLLSGFGGDECVSGHATASAFFPALLKDYGFRVYLRELQNAKRSWADALIFSHPWPFKALRPKPALLNQLSRKRHSSVKHFEYELLQGKHSHHLRMRIEDSAIVAKALGFRYAYPLLYPPLVEFCFKLPPLQKRRGQQARLLASRFLRMHVPHDSFSTCKTAGGILPATLDKCTKEFRQHGFKPHFDNLPFSNLIEDTTHERARLLMSMSAYMLKISRDHHPS